MKKNYLCIIACFLLMLLLVTINGQAQNSDGMVQNKLPISAKSLDGFVNKRGISLKDNPIVIQSFNRNKTKSSKADKSKIVVNSTNAHKLVTTPDGTELWGNVIYSANQENIKVGICSIASSNPVTIKQIVTDPDLFTDGSGVFYNGYFRGFRTISNNNEYAGGMFFEYNTDTWSATLNYGKEYNNVELLGVSEAYDPTTGNVYGCFYNHDVTDYTFGSIDYGTMTKNLIKESSQEYIAMAVNKEGVLYGINKKGNLYTIDKNTGNPTLVGSTGVTPSQYLQSATVDMKTDKMYWAAYTNNHASVLYEVDYANGGTANEIGVLPDNEEIDCLYVPFVPESMAPGKITDLSSYFPNSSNEGNVSFTIPTTSYNGTLLTGTIDYTIYANGELLKSGTAGVGAKVSEKVTVSSGLTNFIVVLKNDVGEGQRVQTTTWIGYDNPTKVRNLRISYDSDNSKVTLSWTAPTSTVHKGYLDKNNLKYKIIRFPDDKVVAEDLSATTFSEIFPATTYKGYTYEIKAINGNVEGQEKYSDIVRFGTPYAVPYSEDFSSSDNYYAFATIDSNDDSNTWGYCVYDNNPCAYYQRGNDLKNADDWLITPPVSLKNDRLYKFSFDTECYQESYPEKISVSFGQGNTSNDIGSFSEIMPTTTISNDKNAITLSNYVKVNKDGGYNFAFHAMSNAYLTYIQALFVDNIKVEEGPLLITPDSVTSYKITPSFGSKLYTTVNFTTPTKTVNGDVLKSISKIEVYRNDTTLIKTIANPATGVKQSFVDNTPMEGFNTYTTVAYNENGQGLKSTITVVVGVDIPLAPKNVKMRMLSNNYPYYRISWESPDSIGVNGYHVNIAKLKYNVYKIEGANQTNEVYGDTLKYYNTMDFPMYGEQKYYYFGVKAQSALGEGAMSTVKVLGGTAPRTPYKESFPNGVQEQQFIDYCVDGIDSFKTFKGISSDYDNGCVGFVPSVKGNMATLSLGKIDLASTYEPHLNFKYLAKPGKNAIIKVAVHNNDADPDTLLTINYKDLTGKEGWRNANVDLTKYLTTKNNWFIMIDFIAISNSSDTPVMIDNINVREQGENDLSADLISAPKHAVAGVAGEYKIRVTNRGTVKKTPDDFEVHLLIDDNAVDTLKGAYLNLGDDTVYTFKYAPNIYSCMNFTVCGEAELFSGGDYNDDNISAKDTVEIIQLSGYPMTTNVKAVNIGSDVVVSWEIPDYSVITENFEPYDAFTDGPIGKWTLVDGDGLLTTTMDDLPYPNNGGKMSYMVFDYNSFPTSKDSYWYQPNIFGNKYLMCPSIDKKKNPGKTNNDWLISPLLSGKAQTVNFNVRSVIITEDDEDSQPCNYQVLYSTTGTDTADFNVLKENTAQTSWSSDDAELPEGTNYFAIRNVSKDGGLFLVDDIAYEVNVKAMGYKILGFNVYRDYDMKRIAFISSAYNFYRDLNVAEGDHRYYVTVMYTDGESNYNQEADITINTTGIKDNSQNSAFYVKGMNNAITINNANNKVVVYTSGGSCIYSGMCKGNLTIPVENGLYIVKVGAKVFKITVK